MGGALGVAVAALAAQANAAPGSDARSPPVALRRVTVSSRDVDTRALVSELAVRRPDLVLVAREPARGDEATLTVTRQRGGFHLELVQADGRTYARDVPADDDIGTRALATDTAAFLEAVESGAIAPERGHSDRSEKTRPSAKDRPEETSDVHLGVGLAPAFVVPVASPNQARAGIVGAGDLAFRVQIVHRIVLEFGARFGGKRAAEHRLVRGRIGFGAGYRLTRGRFDMPIIGALTIEPWSIAARSNGAPRLDARPIDLASPPVMAGFAARATPAITFALRGGSILRVGGGFELSLSGVPDRGVVRATAPSGPNPAFRVAGLETTVLAEIGVWVPWKPILKQRP